MNSVILHNDTFRLENRSAESDGARFWALVFDLAGEKVNKFSRKVMADFEPVVVELEKAGQQNLLDALVVVSGKPGNFIAGADIEMIRAVRNAAEGAELSKIGQVLVNRWEDLPFPTVAAIDGAALGGGCEFALACSAIVMSNDPVAKIGLPEVMLGLLPGMGGCTRLPRKVGIATALDMILTGKNLNGERAYKTGMIEAVLPKEDFENSVFQWVQMNLKALKAGSRIAREPELGGVGGAAGILLERTPFGRALIFKKARQGVLSKTKGRYPAPLEALDVLQQNGASYGARVRGADRARAMDREAEGFGRLAVTEISKNLIRLFFLTEGLKKANGLPSGKSAVIQPVHSAAVLGAGVMGGGIAQLFAEKEISTRMKDLNTKALSLGVEAAARIFQKQVKKKRISKRHFLQKLNRIAPVLDYSGFQSADIIVEAVVENLEIKQKVLRELEDQVGPSCLIATNTSSLSVSAMQSVLKRPERFLGMHFFNPVHRMPLIEVIRGEKTSDEAVASLFDFSKKIGKIPIVVKDAPGFLVNRLLLPYLNEATHLLSEGVPVQEIDRVLLNFGMPMGPMELIDEVGVDVGEKVAHILHEAFGARALPSTVNAKVLAAGMLGKKSGRGFYVYKGRDKEFDPDLYDLIGVQPRSGVTSDEEILERSLLPMINEATRCLDEAVVAGPSDVDLGMIMGTGFPPFRGGLLRYADTLGAKNIVARLRMYQERLGARFEPAPGLIARAEKNEKFHAE